MPSLNMNDAMDKMNMTADDAANVLSSSFQTQMAMAMMKKNRMMNRNSSDSNEMSDQLSKLVLSRIIQMEQNLADVAKEVRGLRSAAATAPSSLSDNLPNQNGSGANHSRAAKSQYALSRKISLLKSRASSKRSFQEAARFVPDVKDKGKGRERDTDTGSSGGGPDQDQVSGDDRSPNAFAVGRDTKIY
jgi:hypothetical protein